MSTVPAATPDVAAAAAVPLAVASVPPAGASVPPAAPVGPGGPSNGAADLEVHPVRFTGTGSGSSKEW